MKSSPLLKSSFSPRSTGKTAGARAGAAEIDAEHGASDTAQRLCALVDHFRVHGAAVIGVRVPEHHGGSHAAGLSGMNQSIGIDGPHRLWLFQQRFEAPDGSGDFTQRHQATSGRRADNGPAAFALAQAREAGHDDRKHCRRIRERLPRTRPDG